MKDITKYQGVIPAFYACYDAEGNISTEGVKALTRHLIAKGVKGVYVGGSSGECIYQHVDERKAVLEAVMSEAKGKLTVIAHVGCNNTADSVELARHAERDVYKRQAGACHAGLVQLAGEKQDEPPLAQRAADGIRTCLLYTSSR